MKISGIIVFAFVLIGCQQETKVADDSAAYDESAAGSTVDADGEMSAPGSTTSAKDSRSSTTGNPSLPQQASQLTAGEFSDALNIDVFLRFLEQDQRRINFPGGPTLRPDMSREDWLALVPPAPTAPTSKVEIALVLDVTGSMGDELRYLQTEWDTIIGDLKALYPDLSLRLSLVAYRDQGDSFVTAAYAFTEDRAAFQTELKKYAAGGGGDYPEAADQALLNAQDFAWGDGTSAKLLFWLADAPPHLENEAKTYEAILGLRAKGVAIYPISASGVAAEAEKIMRVGALVTGGSYLFLTDDSGIGDSHAAPHIPCYNVELLNRLVQRVIAERITGQRIVAQPEAIIRQVGDMQNGVCQTPVQ